MELEHLLCDDHLYEYLKHKKEDGISVLIHKQKEFAKHLENTPGNYFINALENVNITKVASTATLGRFSIASLSPPVSSESCVVPHNAPKSKPIVNTNFPVIIMEALKMSVTDDCKIPVKFPKMAVGKRRPGAQNSSFLRNFFGLCMWGHISDGYCWMTKSDLRKDFKISVLHATTGLFIMRILTCSSH